MMKWPKSFIYAVLFYFFLQFASNNSSNTNTVLSTHCSPEREEANANSVCACAVEIHPRRTEAAGEVEDYHIV